MGKGLPNFHSYISATHPWRITRHLRRSWGSGAFVRSRKSLREQGGNAWRPQYEVTHYTSYKARPFTREQREKTTILFGGLTWKHERLVQGVFNNLNYNAKPLPNITRADLDAGKELIDTGACCPTIFTTGSLVNFLKTEVAVNGKQKTLDDYVFLTAGACGPCRFGQYHESYEMALDGMGLKDFRLFLLAQDQLDQAPEKGGGLEINMPLSLGIVWAILCGDILTDMEYLTRPYEVNPGADRQGPEGKRGLSLRSLPEAADSQQQVWHAGVAFPLRLFRGRAARGAKEI